VKISII